jgi:hypothetical protein
MVIQNNQQQVLIVFNNTNRLPNYCFGPHIRKLHKTKEREWITHGLSEFPEHSPE